MLFSRKNGVTMHEIMPHQPRKSVVMVIFQKFLWMQSLHRFPSTLWENRMTSAPIFW